MGNSRKKKILLFAGSTYIFIIGSLLVLISLILVIILLGYQGGEAESSGERVARKRPALITFDDPTATSVTEVAVVSDQTAQPVETSIIDVSEVVSDDSTNNTPTNSVDTAANNTPAQTNISPTPPVSNPLINSLVPTPTPTLGIASVSTGTPTSTPTPTLTPTPTPTSLPSATPTPTNTPAPSAGSITGRIVLGGAPTGGVTVKLEDQSQNTIAETVSAGDGAYNFPNLAVSGEGYNLVFAQEWNSQYPLDQVVSWGWLGPIPVADGNVVQMPDFDISLLGFEPTIPAPNASFSAASISSSAPIQFEWAAYPSAAKYWVDLAQGQDQTVVWQAVAQDTSLSFDGTLSSGSQIQPGEYWWGVGARGDLGAYKLTVYGYLPVILIVP